MAKPKFDILNIADYRKKLGITQHTFWSGVGISQSAGSRYESGRAVSQPTALLLTLREMGKITADDIAAAAAMIRKAKGKNADK